MHNLPIMWRTYTVPMKSLLISMNFLNITVVIRI